MQWTCEISTKIYISPLEIFSYYNHFTITHLLSTPSQISPLFQYNIQQNRDTDEKLSVHYVHRLETWSLNKTIHTQNISIKAIWTVHTLVCFVVCVVKCTLLVGSFSRSSCHAVFRSSVLFLQLKECVLWRVFSDKNIDTRWSAVRCFLRQNCASSFCVLSQLIRPNSCLSL